MTKGQGLSSTLVFAKSQNSAKKHYKIYRVASEGTMMNRKNNINKLRGSKTNNFFMSSKSELNDSNKEDKIKKSFNKSKWRAQKYGVKNKVDEWKNKRNNYIKYGYKKEQSRWKTTPFDVKKIYDEEEKKTQEELSANRSLNETYEEIETKSKGKAKYLKRFEKEEAEEERKQELLRKKAEKEAALEKYRKEKILRHKILNKKTKKGQPVMSGRMELLFEEIQKKFGQ